MMIKRNSLLTTVFVLLVCLEVRGADEEIVEVSTWQKGTIRGRVRRSEDGTPVNVFLGIPYAHAPVGDLRFKRPKFLERFKTPFDAVKMPPACPQYSKQPFPWYDSEPGQSEDCLYLNIWSPNITDIDEERRPVKVYVHGGGWFETGSNRMGYYDGYGEALDTKDENGNSRKDGVVVVTINYRLGPLGFLSSGTADAPGNTGLRDISLASSFVSNNIRGFGGDFLRIVFVGQGAGAIAVSLFTQTFQLLGTPDFVLNGATFLSLKALEGVDEKGDPYDNNLRLTDELAKAVGCQTSVKDKPADTVACLRGVNVTDLMSAMASLSPQGPPNVFLPQFKGKDGFFEKDPYEDFEYGARQSVLATFTSDEGSHLLTTAYPKVFGVFGENDVPLSAACAKVMTRRFLKKFNHSVADALLGDLDRKPSTENRKKVIQAFGDVYFNCPIVFFAEAQKRVVQADKPTKFYMLEREVNPPYNPWAKWMGSVDFNNVQTDFEHADGTLTINNQTYKFTNQQREQSRVRKEIFVSFANRKELPFDEFTTEDPAYSVLSVDGKLSEKKSNYHGQNCDILRPYFE
ncbi:hypothetical protein JTE90_012133 [Oedothorax gibbosus]|uniref:Carboxylesterase type B domain-containing protein n=1 Tax=Oedothorax gibbosus TaxID=931172 RepID=A0AAV6U8E9_9ARAC|nr:hypothetical protein JTE90_012133 [Oedothorax gibbosus]